MGSCWILWRKGRQVSVVTIEYMFGGQVFTKRTVVRTFSSFYLRVLEKVVELTVQKTGNLTWSQPWKGRRIPDTRELASHCQLGPWSCYELRWCSARSWCPLSEHKSSSQNTIIKLDHSVSIVDQDQNKTSLLACVDTDKMTRHPPPQRIWGTAVSFPITAFIVPFSRLKY